MPRNKPNPSARLAALIRCIEKQPILFIAGADDKICPPGDARKMYNAARSDDKALLIIPGADHSSTFRADPKLYESRVVALLNSISPNHAQQ